MKKLSMLVYVTLAIVLALAVLTLYSFKKIPSLRALPRSEVKHVEWSKNAAIYEVNIRQYSKEGTFKAFEQDLPRLKDLGVEILWIMPVNPIGKENRKGSLGSYYSVRDYRDINPEFGTMDDFKHLVKSIHALGMKVIIDWVPNHTSHDNDLVKTHPEYYMRDSVGDFVSPYDWTDVFRLDYNKPSTRQYMTETMEWWLKETDIDGYRCDVAGMMPLDFWNELRPQLEKIKPIFMLAEADNPLLHQKCFDMTYDWKFHHLMNDIAKGKRNATAIMRHFNNMDSIFPGNSYLMEFTSNHDENSWNGTEYERLGQGAPTFAVLAATIYGMPLIYNGQEAAFNRRLKFFEKDTIDWDKYSLAPMYKTLLALKKRNKALWNGEEGAPIKKISVTQDTSVFVFSREKENQKVLVICNLSGRPQQVKMKSSSLEGNYKEVFTGQKQKFTSEATIGLKPWEYRVYEKE